VSGQRHGGGGWKEYYFTSVFVQKRRTNGLLCVSPYPSTGAVDARSVFPERGPVASAGFPRIATVAILGCPISSSGVSLSFARGTGFLRVAVEWRTEFACTPTPARSNEMYTFFTLSSVLTNTDFVDLHICCHSVH
jgi:hypothetical protein